MSATEKPIAGDQGDVLGIEIGKEVRDLKLASLDEQSESAHRRAGRQSRDLSNRRDIADALRHGRETFELYVPLSHGHPRPFSGRRAQKRLRRICLLGIAPMAVTSSIAVTSSSTRVGTTRRGLIAQRARQLLAHHDQVEGRVVLDRRHCRVGRIIRPDGVWSNARRRGGYWNRHTRLYRESTWSDPSAEEARCRCPCVRRRESADSPPPATLARPACQRRREPHPTTRSELRSIAIG
jgi:hypothetical protein